METADSYEISVPVYQTTERHIQKDRSHNVQEDSIFI
jgi:hypothetical protein